MEELLTAIAGGWIVAHLSIVAAAYIAFLGIMAVGAWSALR